MLTNLAMLMRIRFLIMKKKGTELDEGTRKREVLHSNKSALDKRFDRNVVRTTRENEIYIFGRDTNDAVINY